MSKYAYAESLSELREEYVDVRETPLLLRASEESGEFGGGFTLRLCTNTETLYPGTVGVLAEHGYGVEYIGQPDDLHEWLLVEE